MMSWRRQMQWCGLVVLLAATGLAADEAPKKRVLFLGDVLHAQLAQAAGKDLKEQVSVTYPRIVADHTAAALEKLPELLGEKPWDLIYFNFGHGDLTYRDPNSKQIRKMSKHAGGVRVASPKQYEENLRDLVSKLKATGAKVLWGNSTPLTNLGYDYRLLDENTAAAYNEIAARVMAVHGIPVVDMHGFLSAKLAEEKKPPKYSSYLKHFSKHDEPAQMPIVAAFRQQLGLE